MPLSGMGTDAGEGRPDRSHGRAGQSDLDVLDHGHAVEELGRLEGASDARARHPVWPDAIQPALADTKFARGRSIKAAEDVEERGLAGAVGADHPVHGPRYQAEVDAGEGGEATEAHVEPACLQRHGRDGGRVTRES